MNVNPRIIKELYGNLPDDFFKLFEDKLFYREYFTDAGMAVWIPKTSITECYEQSIIELALFQELKAGFDANPEYDCITLSNT